MKNVYARLALLPRLVHNLCMNRWIGLGIGAIIILGGLVAFVIIPASPAQAPTYNSGTTTTQNSTSTESKITIEAPKMDQKISSPLVATGKARGTWYFEASFPVELQDESGYVIAQGPAQAQDNWMTEDFVPFKITLNFPKQPAGSKGTLVFKKDNPSGDPARDEQIEVPVTF